MNRFLICTLSLALAACASSPKPPSDTGHVHGFPAPPAEDTVKPAAPKCQTQEGCKDPS